MLSTLPYLEHASCVFATIFVGFGILWFINPELALSFFELPYPQSTPKAPGSAELKKTMDAISVVYGIRDVFMGAAIYAAALCGTRQTLGWIVIAAGCVAAVDGAVCKFIVGKGEWNHWSYAPTMVVLGGTMLGALDWIPRRVALGGVATLVLGRIGYRLFGVVRRR